jgi:hypothetical protein
VRKLSEREVSLTTIATPSRAPQADLNMLRLLSTETIGLGAVGAELVMMFALGLDEWLLGTGADSGVNGGCSPYRTL